MTPSLLPADFQGASPSCGGETGLSEGSVRPQAGPLRASPIPGTGLRRAARLLTALCLLLIPGCKTAPQEEDLIPETPAPPTAVPAEEGASPEGLPAELPEELPGEAAAEPPEELTVPSPEIPLPELPPAEPRKIPRTGPLKGRPKTPAAPALPDNPEGEPSPEEEGSAPIAEAPAAETAEAPAPEAQPDRESLPAPSPADAAEEPPSEGGVSPLPVEPVPLLPSEGERPPLNPLAEAAPAPEPPRRTPQTLPVSPDIRDKEQQLAPAPPAALLEAPPAPPAADELDPEIYALRIDHLDRLVLSLDGAGWIFLSFLLPETGTLALKDKSYEPADRSTRFVFDIRGDLAGQGVILLRQDLFSGESQRYLVSLPPREDLARREESPPAAPPAAETAPAPAEPVPMGAAAPLPVEEPPAAPEEPGPSPVFPPRSMGEMTPAELLDQGARYEAPGPEQSLEKAREYYLLILERYPVSLERFKAEERLRYLDRHYFKVQ